MDAILFKMLKGYTLSLDGDIDNLFAISNSKLAEEHGLHFLSEENCNKIFDLIDVIELADNYSKGIIENHIKVLHKVCFKDGFEKAIELNKEKQFSLEDLNKAIELTRSLYLSDDLKSNMLKIDSLKKIQHSIISEIEKPIKIKVKIKTDISAGEVYEVEEFLLDECGCLILEKF